MESSPQQFDAHRGARTHDHKVRKVLSSEKPKTEKSFGAKSRRQRSPSVRNAEGKKSFSAKSRRQRSPLVYIAEGGKVLSCEMPKARYDQPVLKKETPVVRNAEGKNNPVAREVEGKDGTTPA